MLVLDVLLWSNIEQKIDCLWVLVDLELSFGKVVSESINVVLNIINYSLYLIATRYYIDLIVSVLGLHVDMWIL